MATTKRRPTGFTVNEKGEQALLPWLPPELDHYTADTPIGRLRILREIALNDVAKKLDAENKLILAAKKAGQDPGLPEPRVRQEQAKQLRGQAVAAIGTLDQITAANTKHRASLVPFQKMNGSSSFARRQELRNVFRDKMTPEQQMAAMRKDEIRFAVIEMPPEATGISESTHAAYMREQLLLEFPQDMQVIADTDAALGIVGEVLGNIVKGIDDKLVATGLRTPTPEPQKDETWE